MKKFSNKDAPAPQTEIIYQNVCKNIKAYIIVKLCVHVYIRNPILPFIKVFMANLSIWLQFLILRSFVFVIILIYVMSLYL
jgi:hypothetical protein